MEPFISTCAFREFVKPAGPSVTELNRINYTIQNLKQAANDLEMQIRNCNSMSDPTSRQHLIRQASEIYWGWESIKVTIEQVGSDVLDKQFWLSDCDRGLIQITNMLFRINQSFSDQRYPLERL